MTIQCRSPAAFPRREIQIPAAEVAGYSSTKTIKPNSTNCLHTLHFMLP
jgi:hypothetical protein